MASDCVSTSFTWRPNVRTKPSTTIEHERREQMRAIAFERDANDQRHEHSEDEAVERRPVDGGEAQSAEDHAELADDEERLIGAEAGNIAIAAAPHSAPAIVEPTAQYAPQRHASATSGCARR